MTAPQADAVVDGVDVDAVAQAVAACPGVDGLCSPKENPVVTYLPGRVVDGVRVDTDCVVVAVRGRWGVPASTWATQVRLAVAPLVGDRTVQLVLGDVVAPLAGVGSVDG